MMLDSEEIEVKAGIGLNAIVFNKINARIINDIEVSDFDKEKIQQTPSVVGYVVKQNETLWEIAKKFYTTRQNLIEINELEDENISQGDRILITKQIDLLM